MTAQQGLLLVLFLLMGFGCASVGTPRPDNELVGVEKKSIALGNFRLESGQVLRAVTLVYETYGKLAPDAHNTILITHGYTSDQHAAGKYTAVDQAPGWWDGLIGPGKTIDTNRFFVVSSNMLGSSSGSTAPASQNPATGKPYGPDFPDITVRDIVTAQKELLARLGVTHLIAVIGPSYGGRQAFQWAVTFPDFMDGIVPVVSAPKYLGREDAVTALIQRLASDPNWNRGWYYDRGGMVATLTAIRVETLKRYGIEAVLAGSYPDPEQREARIRELAQAWAQQFDANSLVVLLKAAVRFNVEPDLGRIRAKVLYVLSRTDKLFPPTIAPAIMDKLHAARVDATYFEIDSEKGHRAFSGDWQKWAPTLRDFLNRLTQGQL